MAVRRSSQDCPVNLIIKRSSPKNRRDRSQANKPLSRIGLLLDNLLALLLRFSEVVSDQLEKGNGQLNLSANNGLDLLYNASSLGLLVLIVVCLEDKVLSLIGHVQWIEGETLYFLLDCGSLRLDNGETRLQGGETVVAERIGLGQVWRDVGVWASQVGRHWLEEIVIGGRVGAVDNGQGFCAVWIRFVSRDAVRDKRVGGQMREKLAVRLVAIGQRLGHCAVSGGGVVFGVRHRRTAEVDETE